MKRNHSGIGRPADKAASELPSPFVSIRDSTFRKVETMKPNALGIPDEDYAATAVTSILRSIVMADEFEFSVFRVVLWGEQYPEWMRAWSNRAIELPSYSGPVTCRPWSNDADNVIVAATANEVCVMILRSIYLTLLPERPVLWGSENHINAINSYIAENGESIQQRLGRVTQSMNAGEWLRVIALAEIERVKLLNPNAQTIPQCTTTYNLQGLLTIIDADDNETARTYLRNASLPVATGRGKRMTYSHNEAEKFARQVIANPSQSAHAKAAERWLTQQQQGN